MTTPPTPFGHSLFCDDIRQELGQKFTYVGAYQTAMFVHQDFPITLPKFGISVSYYERLSDPDLPVELRVYLPGDSPDRATVIEPLPVETFRAVVSTEEIPKSVAEPLIMVPYFVAFAPLVLREPGAISVRAFKGGKKVKLGALRILRAPADQADSASSNS